jgi:hypothetical protein
MCFEDGSIRNYRVDIQSGQYQRGKTLFELYDLTGKEKLPQGVST